MAPTLIPNSLRKMLNNPTNVQSAIVWGGTVGCTALWLTQPFDYIKSVLTSSPDEDASS